MKHHDGDDSIKCAKPSNMLGRFPDQARLSGSGRIDAQRVETKFSQTVNQAAVATPNVEDSRARGKRRRDGRVEVFPPTGVGHRPEPYLMRHG